MYTRIDLLNELSLKHGYNSYLEIGTESGYSFGAVKVNYKIGVDPDPNAFATHHMTSDEYFKQCNRSFELFLIDGLHEAEQVLKDINNCLEHAMDNFTIVCHDMMPSSLESLSGDCWAAFIALRRTRPDLEMFTINTDHGLGVIRKGSQELLKSDVELTFDNMMDNRDEWMNIISVDEFKARLYA